MQETITVILGDESNRNISKVDSIVYRMTLMIPNNSGENLNVNVKRNDWYD